ncbi:MAG: insulinase family protein [Eubacteriaceae bacterium]|nr:insulinase family protein [Eubacteriaceae bacterium]MDD4508553.1 insulinase family protein [Eubacteriaceae bacterium]
MKLNHIYYGFTLKREEYIEEIKSTARYFVYEKTGTPLLYVSNEDNNKVFQIAFRTPSKNSTGVAHIIEHSVLCGSRKYPVKEPFVELAKGSMNTFLNAMTYPDKTVYPIASTNDKDFMNLMDVYLDAVFYPEIATKPEIFMQEGWHYHLEDKDDPLTYNGVVYNEMKGVYSNPEEILHHDLFQQLYPDSIYGQESGGFPDDIPSLKYEDFVKFHQKFYHPSNAYLYFYGDGDIEKHLQYLDESYLSHFDFLDVNSTIESQKSFEQMVTYHNVYPLSGEENEEEKDYLALGYVLGDTPVYSDLLAFDILTNILLGDNSSPLKKALLDLNICKDVDFSYSSALKQPYFAIVLKNTDQSQAKIILETIQKTLTQLVEDGIDPRDVQAGINSAAFTLKEAEYGTYPKGLMYGLEIMDTWLYGQNPILHLKYNEALHQIRKASKNRGFEALIDRYLIKNTHCALVTISPDFHLAEKNDKQLSDILQNYKDSLTFEEKNRMVDETKKLSIYQSREDSKEALETIPILALNEIEKKTRQISWSEETMMDVPLLWHAAPTNDITYIKLCFDVNAIPQEELELLSLLNKLLFHLSTNQSSNEVLNQNIEIYTGGIRTSVETFDSVVTSGDYSCQFIIKGKALNQNVGKLIDLMSEGIKETRFNEKRIIENIIREIHIAKENKFLTAGHSIAIQRLQSYYSQSASVFQKLGGIDSCRYFSNLDTEIDSIFDVLSTELCNLSQRIFAKDNLTISLTCEAKEKENVQNKIEGLIEKLNQNCSERYHYKFPMVIKNEGIKTASKINYVAKGYNYKLLGYSYSGSLVVLKSILSMDYLWNRIRIKGGAYGASFGINKVGDVFFASYRDPNLEKTIDSYNKVGSYVKGLEISSRELQKYIIGSISDKDVPISPALIADTADTMYFNGLTQEDLQQERDEILATTLKDLQNQGEMLDAVMEKNILCVVGNEESIEKNKDLFNETTYIQK